MNQGTYTVTHTVSNICGSTTSMQTIVIECINACNCPAGDNSYTIGEPGSSASILVSASDLPENGVYNACIMIYGDLEIDVPYSFNQCTIHMQPGSSITVSTALGINNGTVMNGCEKMWRGIILKPGAQMKMLESAIFDAQYAITTADHSHLFLSKNQFIRNYVGLYNPVTSKIFDLNMIGNVFHCEDETLLPSYDLLDPPAAQHTYAGVLIDLLEDTNFGATGQPSNIFHDINNGFVSKLAGYSVNNCRFFNILKSGEYPLSGYGIHAVGDGVSTMAIKGTGITPLFPSFVNCTDGIFVEKSSVDIRDNRMVKVLRGVDIHLGDDHKIDISDNQIECDQFGINLYQCSGALDVQIVNNYICIDSFSYENPNKGNGIYLNDAMIPHPSALISGNYLNLWQRNSGINLRSSNNVIVDDNIIHMSNPNVNLMGIRIQGSTDCNIFCNHVESNTSNVGGGNRNIGLSVSATTHTTYENNTFFRNRFGAHFTSSCLGTSLISNTFNQNQTGLHIAIAGIIGPQPEHPEDILNGNIWLTAPNQPDTKATWEFQGNILDPILISENRILYNTSYPDTKPAHFTTGWFQFSPNPTLLPDPNLCEPYQMLEEEISSQDLTIAGDETASNSIEENMDYIARRYLFRKLDENPELISSNSLLETFWDEAENGTIGKLYNVGKDKATLFAVEESLRMEIQANEVAIKNYLAAIQTINAGIPENPDQEDLDAAAAQKAILFQQLEEIINDQKLLHDEIRNGRTPVTDSIEVKNEIISTLAIYESNEKTVNRIYLETIAKGNFHVTQEQLDELEYIASQCPLTGGIAVYEARSLLSIYDDNYEEDESLCSDEISLIAFNNGRNTTNFQSNRQVLNPSGETVPDSFIFYPNPAKDKVTCIYHSVEEVSLTISDIIGNVIWTSELVSGEATREIPVNGFPDGSYLFSIRDAREKNIHREKIVIIHN